MNRKIPKLSSQFKPDSYQLSIMPGDGLMRLSISGRKPGRPSQRLSFHQKGLRLTGAKIQSLDKPGRNIEVFRINHLPTLEEVRIHTKEMLYPGNYRIEVDYLMLHGNSIKAIVPSRECLPCIDEAEAWANAKLEIKQ